MSVLISYRNLADTAPVISGPDLPNFPLSNLRVRQLSATWRAEIYGSEPPEIFVDRGVGAGPIRVIALLATNRYRPDTEGKDVEILYSHNNALWSLIPNIVGAPDIGCPGLPNNVIGLVGDELLEMPPRYLRIVPKWQPSGDSEYYEAGRLWIGDAIVLPKGCDSGWGFGVRDRGRDDETDGLQVYADPRKKQRWLRLPLSGVPTATAYGYADSAIRALDVPSLQDMMLHAGKIEPVLAFHRYDDASAANTAIWARRTGVYGRLTEDSLQIDHESGPNYKATLTIREER